MEGPVSEIESVGEISSSYTDSEIDDEDIEISTSRRPSARSDALGFSDENFLYLCGGYTSNGYAWREGIWRYNPLTTQWCCIPVQCWPELQRHAVVQTKGELGSEYSPFLPKSIFTSEYFTSEYFYFRVFLP